MNKFDKQIELAHTVLHEMLVAMVTASAIM